MRRLLILGFSGSGESRLLHLSWQRLELPRGVLSGGEVHQEALIDFVT